MPAAPSNPPVCAAGQAPRRARPPARMPTGWRRLPQQQPLPPLTGLACGGQGCPAQLLPLLPRWIGKGRGCSVLAHQLATGRRQHPPGAVVRPVGRSPRSAAARSHQRVPGRKGAPAQQLLGPPAVHHAVPAVHDAGTAAGRPSCAAGGQLGWWQLGRPPAATAGQLGLACSSQRRLGWG